MNLYPSVRSCILQKKAITSRAAFLKYPDHKKPFLMYCDAGDTHLGAAILQDNSPVAFYSHNSPAQRIYTVGEKELLSAVEALKEFHTTLLGSPEILGVHTTSVRKRSIQILVVTRKTGISEFLLLNTLYQYIVDFPNGVTNGVYIYVFFKVTHPKIEILIIAPLNQAWSI